MFNELRITNVKSFADTNPIPLRPITLIYGQNSSGKSSIIQSLLMLKQTIEDPEDNQVVLQPKGNIVDLGSYREFIHKHDITNSFSFKMNIDASRIPVNTLGMKSLINILNSNNLGVKLNFDFDDRQEKILILSTNFFFGNDEESIFSLIPSKLPNNKKSYRRVSGFFSGEPITAKDLYMLSEFNKNHNFWQNFYGDDIKEFANSLLKQSNTYKLEIEYIENEIKSNPSFTPRKIKTRQARIALLKNKIKRYNSEYEKVKIDTFSSHLDSYYNNYLFGYRNFIPIELTEFREEDEELIGDMDFMRYVYRSGKSGLPSLIIRVFNYIKEFLEGIIYIGPLRDYPERYYIFTGKSMKNVGKTGKMVPNMLFKNSNLVEEVNQRISDFGINYMLKISQPSSRTSELYDVFAIRLIDKDTNSNVSIMDVGFGISQVLPIIVQSMVSRKKTLVIEQPEIHLHPRLQAELGSLFADCIKKPFENNFIIETHSEHLMLRLQKLIRQRKIKNTDVSVLYVDKGSNGSECLHLRLDEDGDFIDEWPDGFFEDSYREIFG